MKARTEDDVLSHAPITVRLGDKDYSIPLLAVMAQREWRKNLFAELGPILEPFSAQLSDEGESMDMAAFLQKFRKGLSDGLTAALLQFPDKMIELLFAYREYGYACELLTKEGIEDRDLLRKFNELRAAGPLTEAPDLPHDEILARATEEQIATSFSAVMAIAFPSLPQIETMRNLARATAALQQ
jgi:hypothetical protein